MKAAQGLEQQPTTVASSTITTLYSRPPVAELWNMLQVGDTLARAMEENTAGRARSEAWQLYKQSFF